MRKVKYRKIKTKALIGFGYWKVDHKDILECGGIIHNIVFLCFHIEVGWIGVKNRWLSEKGRKMCEN